MRPKNRTILTVDDTPANIRLLTHYLQKEGYRVITAEDGFEGFKAAVQYHPDLVLLDIMMPGTDGYEVCELLKAEEETKDIPVVFLTAKADVEDKIRGFELGAVDYITKPFNLVEIATRIQTQLNLKSLQEQNKRYHKTLVQMRRLINLGVLGDHVVQDISTRLDEIGKNLKKIEKKIEPDRVGQKTVNEAMDSMSSLVMVISKLSELTRLISSENEKIDVNNLIDDTLDLIDAEFGDSVNIDFERSDQIPSIRGDSSLLQQALFNLLSYLISVAKSKGISIQITEGPLPDSFEPSKRISKGQSCVHIEVDGDGKLNGRNMDLQQKLDSLLANSSKKDFNLGLSATVNIIKAHEGIVDIQSQKEKGTKAVVCLPSSK